MEQVNIQAERIGRIACKKCSRHLDVSALEPFSRVKCPDCGAEQHVPMKLGNFLLLEAVGQGGMGAVYKALDQSLGRYVAIKVLQASLGSDKNFSETFFREARAIAALNHPNIVQIYSVGEAQGQPYMVMELVAGGRMDKMISGGHAMPEAEVLQIALDVTDGLEAAQDIGMIHADIKPANILFDNKGTAKVVDFGLARFVNWKDEGPREIWGTPYYIAPERARGQPMDHRSDIYSLGATLYHALGARPPFEGNTATDVVLARLKEPAIGLRVIRPEISPETADVIARMLESDPFRRYPTYQSLRADLQEALRIVQNESSSRRAGTSKKPSSSRKTIWFILLLCLVLGGVLAILYFSNGTPPTPRKTPPAVVARQPVETQTGTVEVTTNAVNETDEKPVHGVINDGLDFTVSEDKSIAEALAYLGEGLSFDASRELNTLRDKQLEDRTNTLHWFRVLAALPDWLDKDQQSVNNQLLSVSTLTAGYDETNPPPSNLKFISNTATWLMNKGPVPETTTNQPSWASPFIQALQGLDAYRNLTENADLSALSQYTATTPDSPLKWPWALQPFANHILEQDIEYKSLKNEVMQNIADQHPGQVLPKVNRFISTALPVYADLARPLQGRIQMAMDDIAAKKKAEMERQHAEAVQSDLDKLAEIKVKQTAQIAAKDFLNAKTAARMAASSMKTDQGKAAQAELVNSYTRMDDLKTSIIGAVRKMPYTPDTRYRLGGSITDANNSSLTITLGGPVQGSLQKEWCQISPALFCKMAEHAMKTHNLGTAERADWYVSIAVYCYYSPQSMKGAKLYASRAVQTDPKVAETVKLLMPKLSDTP